MTRRRFRLPLYLETLEDRTLLSAANVFADFNGIVTSATDEEHVNIALTQQHFTINTRNEVLLGFHVSAPTDSALDPGPVVVHNANGTPHADQYLHRRLEGNNR